MHTDAESWTVLTFGQFSVCRNGVDVTPAGLIPARAVKYLALVGHPVHFESLSDVLWPDIEAAVARVRLRNVIARVRSSCGPLIERHGDLIGLSRFVDVDLWRFNRGAIDALMAVPAAAEVARDAARRALRIYAGELLPGDIYADWAQPTRVHVRRLAEALVDVAAGRASNSTDIDLHRLVTTTR